MQYHAELEANSQIKALHGFIRHPTAGSAYWARCCVTDVSRTSKP
jgi:hypothetical protein